MINICLQFYTVDANIYVKETHLVSCVPSV